MTARFGASGLRVAQGDVHRITDKRKNVRRIYDRKKKKEYPSKHHEFYGTRRAGTFYGNENGNGNKMR